MEETEEPELELELELKLEIKLDCELELELVLEFEFELEIKLESKLRFTPTPKIFLASGILEQEFKDHISIKKNNITVIISQNFIFIFLVFFARANSTTLVL